MTLLAITADTWIITGLGFGIVLLLLFFLVYVLLFFGWVMQKATAPRKPKTDDAEMAAIAMALHLSQQKHDEPTSMITFDRRDTAWNPKSEGFNNVGF